MDHVLQKMNNHFPAASVSSVDAYLHSLREIPILDVEEERALAVRFREHGDLEAARKLVLSNLRFVAHIARGYLGYGLPLADLIQEGNLGLMKAVRRFDPERGVRLVSFAVHWIRAEIHEYVLRNWSIVKVATTKAQRKLFFNLRSAKKRLGWFSRQEVESVAEDLGVKPETVLEMEKRLSHQDTSFDLSADSDEEEFYSPSSFLKSEQLGPEEEAEQDDWNKQASQQLKVALSTLDERSRSIVTRRWLQEPKNTLKELADEYGISAERVRQLEQRAMRNLKTAISL